MKTLTIFVSSPGDVQNERVIVGSVIEKLQAKFWSFVRLELVLWEKKALRATAHFQDELVRPSDCDIVLGILWHRLGTPLPEQFLKEDGGRFDSGTEWEIVEAFEGFEKSKAELGAEKATPDVLIYRRMDARVPQEDVEQEELAAEQERKAEQFFSRYFLGSDGTNKRAFSPYHKLEEFEENLSDHLTDLILKRIPTLTRDFTPPPINGNPFLGLSHFDFHHNDRFFGRNRAIREVLEKLKAQDAKGHPFVLIYGASGYGKSSLMRAGVAPRLTAKAYLDDIPQWRRILITPSLADGNPIDAIARALIHPESAHADTPEEAPLIGLSELADKASSLSHEKPESQQEPATNQSNHYDSLSLARHLSNPDKRPFAIAAIVEALDGLDKMNPDSDSKEERGTCLLLQIDQFEELFTTESITSAQRENFFSLLSHLVHTKRIWIVATMRSEYFPQIAESPNLLPLVQHGGGYILEAPDDKELLEIIRYPALAARLDFENDPTHNNRNLSDDIYDAARKQPDALPLLEFTLDELYQLQDIEAGDRTLNYDEYEAIGRLEGAIAKRAQTTYESLEPHQQDAHQHLFAKLVKVQSSGAGTATKKRAYLDTLQQAHPGAPAFLKAFQQNNLLVTDHEAYTKNTNTKSKGRTTVTLAHEALLTQWPLFKNWIEEHRTDLQAETRLQNQTSRWLEAKDNPKEAKARLLSEANLAEALRVKESELFDLDQDTKTYLQASEKKAKRKTRFLQSALVLFAMLTLGAGYLGYLSNENAKKEKTAREEATNKGFQLEKRSQELSLKNEEILAKSDELTQNLAKSDLISAYDYHEKKDFKKAYAYLARSLRGNPKSIEASTLAWTWLNSGHHLFPNKSEPLPANFVTGNFTSNGNFEYICTDGKYYKQSLSTGKTLDQKLLKSLDNASLLGEDFRIKDHIHFTADSKLAIFLQSSEEHPTGILNLDIKSGKINSSKHKPLDSYLFSILPSIIGNSKNPYIADSGYNPEKMDIPDNYIISKYHGNNFKLITLKGILKKRLQANFEEAKTFSDLVITSLQARTAYTIINIGSGYALELTGPPITDSYFNRKLGLILLQRTDHWDFQYLETIKLTFPFKLNLTKEEMANCELISEILDEKISINKFGKGNEFRSPCFFGVDPVNNIIMIHSNGRSIFSELDNFHLYNGEQHHNEKQLKFIITKNTPIDFAVSESSRIKVLTIDGITTFPMLDNWKKIKIPEDYSGIAPSADGKVVITTDSLEHKNSDGHKTLFFDISSTGSKQIIAASNLPLSFLYPEVDNYGTDLPVMNSDGSWVLLTTDVVEGSTITDFHLLHKKNNEYHITELSTHTHTTPLWISAESSTVIFLNHSMDRFSELSEKKSTISIINLSAPTNSTTIDLPQFDNFSLSSETNKKIELTTNNFKVTILKDSPHTPTLQMKTSNFENGHLINEHEPATSISQTETIIPPIASHLAEKTRLSLHNNTYQIRKTTIQRPDISIFDVYYTFRTTGYDPTLLVSSKNQERLIGINPKFEALNYSKNMVNAVGLQDRDVFFWSPLPTDVSPPEWLPQFIEAFSGCKLEPDGTLNQEFSQLLKPPQTNSVQVAITWTELAKKYAFQFPKKDK